MPEVMKVALAEYEVKVSLCLNLLKKQNENPVSLNLMDLCYHLVHIHIHLTPCSVHNIVRNQNYDVSRE